jgi:hypothetical protein
VGAVVLAGQRHGPGEGLTGSSSEHSAPEARSEGVPVGPSPGGSA